jgi:hypothetical protein
MELKCEQINSRNQDFTYRSIKIDRKIRQVI